MLGGNGGKVRSESGYSTPFIFTPVCHSPKRVAVGGLREVRSRQPKTVTRSDLLWPAAWPAEAFLTTRYLRSRTLLTLSLNLNLPCPDSLSVATFFHFFWSAYRSWRVTVALGAAGLTEPLILSLLPSRGSVLLTVAVTLNAPALAAGDACLPGAASAEARAVALSVVARTIPATMVVRCIGVAFPVRLSHRV